jgi:ABC-type Fe3+ transport system substrate-binding protein
MRSTFMLLAAIATLGAACAAPAPAAPPAAPAGAAPGAASTAGDAAPTAVEQLIATARANGETELGLSWSINSLGGIEGAKQFETLMNQMYGTGFKVNLTPGPSMQDMGVKITQEFVAGQKASSGVYLALDSTFAGVVMQGAMEEFDYATLSPRIGREMVAARNSGVEIYSTVPAIVYNSELVARADVPRRLEEVLDPKWRGRVSTTEGATYFDLVAMRPEWGPERMKTYMGRLSNQIGGLVRTSAGMNNLVSGEFVMQVLSNTHAAREVRNRGAPIDAVVPEDVAVVGAMHMGVPRHSAQPNLAKLFINMIMSEAGQRLVYQYQLTDHWLLPGSQSGDELRDLKARGVHILATNVQFALDHPELNELSRDFVTILREKRGG